jgi:spermidine/putrescine transport system substrate-binding protein
MKYLCKSLGIGLTVFALAGAGCGNRGAQRELNLLAWSEYMPQPVIDGFTRETGIRVNYESFSSNEEMLSKLLSGAARYDLIQPSEYVVQALARAGKLEALDFTRLPNFRHIGPQFRNLPHDPEQKFSVPWMTGTVGIVVNTERVREPIRGYRDVFQPRFKGRIVVVKDNREMVTWALAVLGAGPNDVTPERLAQVRPILAEWIPLVKVFDSDSPKTPLLNGDCDLGIVWSGEAAYLWRQDRKFKYILAEEGAHKFVDNVCIPAGAPNRDAAYAFIDHILRPEVSKLISEAFPYTNPNLVARKLLAPEDLANPASYPPEAKLEVFTDIGKTAAAIDKLVTDLKSAR